MSKSSVERMVGSGKTDNSKNSERMNSRLM
jgi:hypothetical protein